MSTRQIILIISVMFFVACGLYIWWFIKINNWGWNNWQKELNVINEDETLKIPVEIKWDFVDIKIKNKNIKDVDVIIKVVNTGKKSLSVLCGHNNDDKRLEGQLVHKSIEKDKGCLVFNGSLNEFIENWCSIRIENYNRKKIKATIIIESANINLKDILAVANWHSCGL